MKKIVSFALVLVFALSSFSALAACEHDFYQAEFAYPTCETDGYYVIQCTKCGYSERVITDEATGHDFEIDIVKESTCADEGYSEGVCRECGLVTRETFPLLDHSWKDSHILEEATCTRDGSMRIYCTMCGISSTKVLKKGHLYSAWQVTEEATDRTEGTRMRECERCGKTEKETFYPDGTLYKDIKNHKSEVESLQTLLTELGFLNDKIDGIFGKKTQAAVKDFQEEYGLREDGIAWPETLHMLGAAYEIQLAPSIKPTENGAAYPDFCTLIELDNRETYWDMCEVHSDIFMTAANHLGEDITYETYYLAYIDAWTAEVDRLYNKWFALCPPEDQPMVLTGKAMFTGYLSALDLIWERMSPQDPGMGMEYKIERLQEQCMLLCRIVQELTESEG